MSSLFSLGANPIGLGEAVSTVWHVISGVMAIAAVALILMRKKIGKQMAIANIIVGTVLCTIYMAIVGVAAASEIKDTGFVVMWTGGIAFLVILTDVLSILYFLKSRRVKETLVN